MKEDDLQRLREKLLRQRQEIFRTRLGLEQDWNELSEPEIEREEVAQKTARTELLRQLDERETQELADIDRALDKMEVALFGICETCGKHIPLSRLEVEPATRYCRTCRQQQELATRVPPVR